MTIKFRIRGQSLTAHFPEPMVAGTIGYFDAEFNFTPEWSGLNKWLHLMDQNGNVYDIEIVDGRADRLNLPAGDWLAYIHGNELTDGVPKLRLTTSPVRFVVEPVGDLSGALMPEIPVSAEEQIAANAAYAVKVVDELKADAGLSGAYYKPSISTAGDLTWTTNKPGLPVIPSVNLRGPVGPPGKDGKDGKDAVLETDDTLTLEDGVLRVNTAKDVEQDNTLPVTSAAVFVEIGNIDALLQTI